MSLASRRSFGTTGGGDSAGDSKSISMAIVVGLGFDRETWTGEGGVIRVSEELVGVTIVKFVCG